MVQHGERGIGAYWHGWLNCMSRLDSQIKRISRVEGLNSGHSISSITSSKIGSHGIPMN